MPSFTKDTVIEEQVVMHAGCYVVRDEEEFEGVVTREPTFQAVRG